MKNSNFIKLTPDMGDLTYYVNAMTICGITEYENFRVIHTIGGQVYSVKETSKEILDLIENTNKFTLVTK